MGRAGRLAVVAVLTLSLGGCSLLMRRADSDRPAWKEPQCSAGPEAPVADGLVASLGAIIAVVMLAETLSCEGQLCGLGYLVVAPAGASALVFGLSSAYGASVRRNCRRAWDTYRAERPSDDQRRAACTERKRSIDGELDAGRRTRLLDDWLRDCGDVMTP